MKAILIGVAVAAIAAGVIWVVVSTEDQVTHEGQQPTDNAIAAIALPENLSANAEIGMAVFEAKCAAGIVTLTRRSVQRSVIVFE